MRENEGVMVTKVVLAPLTPKDIQDRVEEIKRLNEKISGLFQEIQDGRAKKAAVCVEFKNFDTGKIDTYCQGVLIFSTPMQDADCQIEIPADAVGDLLVPVDQATSVDEIIQITDDDCP